MSVCLSNAWIVTKRKKVVSRFLSPRLNSEITLILRHNVSTESHVYSKIPIVSPYAIGIDHSPQAHPITVALEIRMGIP